MQGVAVVVNEARGPWNIMAQRSGCGLGQQMKATNMWCIIHLSTLCTFWCEILLYPIADRRGSFDVWVRPEEEE